MTIRIERVFRKKTISIDKDSISYKRQQSLTSILIARLSSVNIHQNLFAHFFKEGNSRLRDFESSIKTS
jgi:hypothetical protein